MNPETTTIAAYAVALVMAATTGTLAFLAKKAFNDTTEAVRVLGAKFDVITATQARSDGDVRAMQAKYDAVIDELKRRLDRVEQVQREIV